MRKSMLTPFRSLGAAAGFLLLAKSISAHAGSPLDERPETEDRVQPADFDVTAPLKNSATGFCLDGDLLVHAMDCNGSLSQKWTRSNLLLKSNATDCLESDDAGNLKLAVCIKDATRQAWRWSGSGYRNVATHFCLESDASGFVFARNSCNGNSYQNWR